MIPPIPQNVRLMNITENRIDCSCRQKEHQNVDKDVLLNVHVTCQNTSTDIWRKQHFDNPFCVFPTVHVVYEEIKDGEYIINCAGYGFPLPRVTLKHEGHVITNRELKSKIIFGPVTDKNVTCLGNNSVGITEATWNQTDDENKPTDDVHNELTDTFCTTPPHTFSAGEEGDVSSVFNISISFIFYTVTMFVSSAFTNVALVVSLFIFFLIFAN